MAIMADVEGTVRTVTAGDDGTLVAVRWDDGTLTEDVWHGDPPQPGDRVARHE